MWNWFPLKIQATPIVTRGSRSSHRFCRWSGWWIIWRAHQYLNSNIKVTSRTSEESFGCAGLKFRFLDFKILLNENGWSRPKRDGTVLLSNPLSLGTISLVSCALAWTNLSATFLRKIHPAMSSFLYREPHKTMIGFLMKSFHFRWTKPFTSWESQHFPWKLSFSIKNFWWNQREKVFDWIRQKRRKFQVSIPASWEQTFPAGSDNL